MNLKVSKRGIWLVIYAAVMLVPTYFESSFTNLLDNAFFIWAMLIVLRNRIIPNRFICAFSLYYIYLTVITFISGTDMADIHLIISVAKMVVFLCVLDFQINYSARIAINGLLFVVGVYIILDFISIVLYPDGLYQSVTVWNEWTSTSAAQWILGNKNNRCYWYFIAIILSVWKLALEKNRGNRVIIYAICSISLLAMIGTKSSTSTIATIVAIIAAWYGMRNTSKNLARINAWGVMLAYCSVQILIFMGSLPFISSIVVKLFGKDLTFSGRTKIRIQMPVLIAQKPIWGWGQLSGSTVGSILGNKFFTSAHNQWLNTLFQGGVILFLLVALIIIWLANSTRKFEKNIGNMKLLMLLSIMIDMMFESILSVFATWIFLYIIYKYPETTKENEG